MYNISKIGYKQYGEFTKEVLDDGYFVELEPQSYFGNCHQSVYCHEINIMIKIKNNDENYFDFTKGMVDIGSNFGTYSIVLDFDKYYLFDGNPEYNIISQFNMLLHHKFNQLKCFTTLLSDKVEKIKYDGYDTNNIKNLELSENILTSTLDSYNLNNIGFIKVDVEGMEEKVLRGGIGTIIRNNYPPILFECWDVRYLGMSQEKHDSLQHFLESLGYEILWYWGDNETHLAIHK